MLVFHRTQINPQQTIPFLDDNGIHIVDSHAICAYLSDKYGADDSLYPKDLAQRATVNSRLHFDSGNLFSNLRALFRPILYEKSAEMQEERISAVRSQWDTMEKILENGLYMCGNEMTIADLCCIATVSSLTEIATIDADKCPKLLEWIDRMSELPYYEEKNGAGSRTIQSVVLEVRQQNANALG